ncbi:L-threonylcarbamoyladenylate synthase [Alkalibacter mobilis]|uniref:L-threonylcarbamoyladenylate synthase n=1 Tax=Alkalibacter mobilis TaxID=2787712 RepID=UPI00189E6E42|nr:L-threonylcarbamoyladenylate synthase [Alkalibacter mobilis]MBF7096166.1 threonylcarbamoyl-AMP synthase [Alkalibacter mobilis]
MNTKIIKIESDDLARNDEREKIQYAAEVIKGGGTVVFPTETVYGLGADGMRADSVKKIYTAKGRPSDNPMILHISNLEMLKKLTVHVSSKARALMEEFWPGPLTLVMKKTPEVPLETTGGLDTVAVRMPDHPVAMALIEAAGVPLAAPSANLSGKPSPTSAAHVIEDLDGRVDVIISSQRSRIGLESTVVDVTEEVPVLLRPGGISLAQLQDVVGEVKIDKGVKESLKEGETPKAPGMKYRHYAPEGKMILVKGPIQGVIYRMKSILEDENFSEENRVALVPTEFLDEFAGYAVIDMGSINSPQEIMERLYSSLRKCNQIKADTILAPLFEDEEKFLAVNNRLSKAAGYNIVTV